MRKYVAISTVILAVLLVSGPLAMEVVSGQETAQREEVEVDIDPAEQYENTKTQNVGREDLSQVTTNTDIWTQDFGNGSVPRGVYRGPLFESSLMELDYKPRWRWKREYYYDGGQGITEGEIGSTTLIQKAEFGSEHIMNGASEVWIQLPFSTETIEPLHLSHHDYGDWLLDGEYYSSVHVYKGKATDIDVKMDKTAICQKSTATVNGTSGVHPEAVVPITPDDYYGNRGYVKINTFIESEQTYTFAFNLLTGGEKPELYITDSDNFEPATIQYNREGNLYTEMIFDYGNDMIREQDSDEGGASAPYIRGGEYDTGTHEGSEYFKDTQHTDIHLGTSFVFTRGVGNHYMFGKEIHMEANETLEFFPDVDWTQYSSSNKQYMSFYLPFKSEKKLGSSDIECADIEIGYENTDHGYALYHWSQWDGGIDWNYQNFILYSTSENLTKKGESGGDIFSIRFKEPATLTIPFTAKELEYDFYDGNDSSSVSYQVTDTARFRESRMMKVDGDMRTRVLGGGSADYDDFTYDHQEWFYYTPYLKAEITEDIWAQVDSVGEGKESYSHAYEPTAYYSDMDFKLVDKSNSENSVEKAVSLVNKGLDWGGRAVEAFGETVSQVGSGVKVVADSVKDGVTELINNPERFTGWFYDGLDYLWENIQQMFDVLYNSIMEFVGWITSIFEEIIQVLGVLTERLAYIGGMLGFVAIMAGTSKLVKLTEWGGR